MPPSPATAGGVFPAPSIMTTVLITIALYNAFELVFIVFSTFRPLNGLYFYSFLISTAGIVVYLLGIILRTYQLSSNAIFFTTLLIFGWIPMVTGQAVLLYSRLHYVSNSPRMLRWVFLMIVIIGFIGHVPAVAMVYGAVSAKSLAWVLAFLNFAKAEVTLFFLQSVIISSLYVWHAFKMLKMDADELDQPGRRALRQLILLNFIWVTFDLSVVIFEWSSPSTLVATWKAVSYSVKLKLQYRILNKLPYVLPPPPQPNSTTTDLEKGDIIEDSRKTLRSHSRDNSLTTITLETFNGKTQIISTAQFNGESDFPANEAYRSPLNDTVLSNTMARTRSKASVIQHWADDVDDEDDIDSFYGRSRRTMSEAGTALSPSPVFKR